MKTTTTRVLSGATAVVSFVFVTSTSACGGNSLAAPPKVAPEAPARPYGLFVPQKRGEPSNPLPLVVVLHGYSIDGAREARMLRLDALARSTGFALAWPDGTKDKNGYRFWNATDACCNWFGSTVDDVAFLDGMVDEIIQKHAVDPKRVYFVGHSNGAFMAHRYACERAHRVAAIATLAGVPWKDEARCKATEPVAVLHMQGTADTAIAIQGGRIEQNPPYAAALDTAKAWAKRNQCVGSPLEMQQLYDFDKAIAGPETRKTIFAGCAKDATVELWTLEGSSHEPDVSDAYAEAIYGFLMAHPKQ